MLCHLNWHSPGAHSPIGCGSPQASHSIHLSGSMLLKWNLDWWRLLQWLLERHWELRSDRVFNTLNICFSSVSLYVDTIDNKKLTWLSSYHTFWLRKEATSLKACCPYLNTVICVRCKLVWYLLSHIPGISTFSCFCHFNFVWFDFIRKKVSIKEIVFN